MGKPKVEEDPEAKSERLRQRARAETERRDVSQQNAESLTKDIQAVFSRPSLFAMLSGNRLTGTGFPRTPLKTPTVLSPNTKTGPAR